MDRKGQQIVSRDITDQMRTSYLEYAMSVIISRALPDVCDGLKPVQRRILFAMRELGLSYNRPYKKCARIVGDTMGKFHPHGDAAIYNALVRMVQAFSSRYPLIDGQGNYGSVDDDPPAAMRYTEARLARISEEMLADIDKDVVDFVATYDNAAMEPRVLPAKIPNLLINGSSGIAVGMATQIPPHNLSEVADGLVALIDNPGISIDELMQHIQGPDFPTAGFILGREGISQAYHTGHGRVVMRAKATFEAYGAKGERQRIVITELPYQRQKNAIIKSIADLVHHKRIEGIQDIRDESDRQGMRVVIDLKRDAQKEVVLRQLFKHTELQDSYNVILLALVNNQPRLLNLKQMLECFVEFRQQVVRRRTSFELKKAKARAHIVEGLKIALANLDAVIKAIRGSRTVEEAQGSLMSGFGLTAQQAKAILDMRLQNLTRLEREKLDSEYSDLQARISRFEEILGDERLVLRVVRDEILQVKRAYGDQRRTMIVEAQDAITEEELIPVEDVVVTATGSGYIKRTPLAQFAAQRRSGQGSYGMATKDEDFIESIFVTTTHDWMMFFTNTGRVYLLRVYNLPAESRHSKGRAIRNLLNLREGENVRTLFTVKNLEFEADQYLVMATRMGFVKKTPLGEFRHIRSDGIIAIRLRENDSLVSTRLTDGFREIFLATRLGYAIRFAEDQIRPTARATQGVVGMRLRDQDEVVGMEAPAGETTILSVTENGYGKRSKLSSYRLQRRGGRGVINIRCKAKNGNVVGVAQVSDGDEVIMITQGGKTIRFRVDPKSLRVTGRATMGVRLQSLVEGDKVASVFVIAKDYGVDNSQSSSGRESGQDGQ